MLIERRELELRIAEAQRALADLVERERAAWADLEPPDKSMLRFYGTFRPGGATYSFVAVRHTGGIGRKRSWYISRNDHQSGQAGMLPSPATWEEIIRFAVPRSIWASDELDRADLICHGRPYGDWYHVPVVAPR